MIKKIIIIGFIILSFLAGYVTGSLLKREQPVQEIPDISVPLAKKITVLRPCYMTAEELNNYFKGTPLYGTGKYLLIAEKESGIGADVLAAIMAHESNFGRNYWTSHKCNNPFSWGVYGGKCHIPYDSVIGCIIGEYRADGWHDGVPVLIRKLYLTKGAKYYAGESLYAIGTHYAEDKSWYRGVESKLNSIPKTEEERAREWAVASKVFKPSDVNKGIEEPRDYWTKPLTKRDFAIILYRVGGK